MPQNTRFSGLAVYGCLLYVVFALLLYCILVLVNITTQIVKSISTSAGENPRKILGILVLLGIFGIGLTLVVSPQIRSIAVWIVSLGATVSIIYLVIRRRVAYR